MRVSDYIIFIPLPKRQQALLVHGYTGALDIIDSALANQLQQWHAASTQDCEAIIDSTVGGRLEARGYLTSRSQEEELTLVDELSRRLHDRDRRDRTKFFIIPSYNCQLRCSYCFERNTQNRGMQEHWLGSVMSTGMVDSAFNAMDQLQFVSTRNPVTLYGGEPFTLTNRSILSYILQQGHKRGYRFVAITNAVDLDVYRSFLQPDIIEGLLITLDGPQHIHDSARHYPKGKGTFEKIVGNLQIALKQGLKLRIRINTDRTVMAALPEFSDFLLEQGWVHHPNVTVYCQVVWKSPAGTQPQGESLRGESLDLAEVIEYLQQTGLNQTISAGEPIRYQLDMLLKNNPLAAFASSNCGVEKGMFLFDPLGYTYVCTEHVGLQEQCVGEFHPDVRWYSTVNKWHERTIYNLPHCLRCCYALLCGGGCAFHAIAETGEMYRHNCNRFGRQFELIAQEYFDKDFPLQIAAQPIENCD